MSSRRKRPSQPRRLWLLAVAALLGSLLTGAPAAAAAPEVAGANPDTSNTWEPWNPQPKIPEFTLPSGEKVQPLSKLEPTAAKTLPGFGHSPGAAFKSTGTVRVTDDARPQDDPEQQLICTWSLVKTTVVRVQGTHPMNPPPNETQFSQTDYRADLVCNFYFTLAYGFAALVDRSEGFDGRTIDVGTTISSFNSYYGTSTGSLEIPGEMYDGGRQLEVVFDITIVSPGIWGGCQAPAGTRLLRCDGIGTSTLHAAAGTDVFGSGLNPPVIRYVALGDSYSSGTGALAYDTSTPWGTSCRRSRLSYPYQLVGRRAPIAGGPAIDTPVFRACHGAQIPDMRSTQLTAEQPQLFWLNRQATRLVTVSVGGNDLGFAPKLENCVNPFANCAANGPLVTPAELQAKQTQLTQLFREIRGKMRPDGFLVVLTYPRFVARPGSGEPTDCLSTLGILDAEATAIDDAVVAAREMIGRAVSLAGDTRIRIVDVSDAMAGHKVCSTNPWTTGVEVPDTQLSFHPNAEAYVAYGQRVAQALTLGF
jgi:lysophospholipase L1-like esterase